MDTVHECDGQTDRQTDGRTDRITITKTVQRRASHGKKYLCKAVLFYIPHNCSDDTGITQRKQHKIVYRIFACKFPLLSLQCYDLLTLQ